MLNNKTHNKYFEVNAEDGFNIPLKHTTFNKQDFIPLKNGDIIHVIPEVK